MRFRDWLLLQENIIVNAGNGEASLGKSRESGSVVEFSYGAGEYHSAFEVWPFSEERPGYVKLSDGAATVVGIIKKTPIEPGNGADRAFIKSLAASLAAAGLKPLPYKEGDSPWMGVMSDAGVDKDHPAMNGMKGEREFSNTETPEMGKAAPNARKATAGMSFSRMSGSWAYFIRVNPGSATYQIDKVVAAMKKAAQPLVDNDVIENYRIVKGWDYKGAEVVWSKRGKEEHEDEDTKLKRSVSYIKFLADRMLANHPEARAGVLKYFRNSWDKDLKPENTRVPLDDLRKYVQHYHSESPFLNFFIDAVEGDKQHMYAVMEDAAKTPDQDEAVRRYREIADDEYSYMVENPRLFMNYAISVLSMSDLMGRHASGNFERFRREYEEAINGWLGSGEPIRPSDVDYLKKLSEYIDIDANGQIEDAHKKIKSDEEEHKKKQEEKAARDKERIAEGSFMYMQVGQDASWNDVPLKYLDGDDVEVAQLALDEEIVNKEDVFQAAHEKASEEAWSNAEERKSETYGQDTGEVESDIDYEWDDYMDDREFDEGEFEGLSKDQEKQKIKDEYFDDFVGWKKERLKKEEEEESWRYEPEADESDVWKYEKEIAEESAYENGLVIFKWPEESKELEVWLHSKHFDKAREAVKRSIAISLKDKGEHGEPILRRWQDVSFTFVDKGSGEGKVMKAEEV